jgi:hypothetical protein
MDIARHLIDLAEDLVKLDPEDGALRSKTIARRAMHAINYKEVRMDQEQLIMRIFPINILPTQPAGRVQAVQDLYQAGFIDTDTALSLLDFPDLESKLNLKLAAQQNIERKIELMLDDGEAQFPEPFDNLQLSLTMVQEAYNRAKIEKVNEDKLELMRNYMDHITQMLAEQNQPAMPPQGNQEIIQAQPSPGTQLQQ